MIYIIEPQCKGYEHFSNNISMLKLLPIIFHNKSIKFFAYDSHADAMNLMYGEKIFEDIAQIGDIENAKIFMKKLLIMAKNEDVEKIIFLSISSFQAYYVEKFLKSVSFEVFIFLHYVASEIARRPSFKPQLFDKWLYFTLFFGRPSVKKIVYSESIAQNLNKYLLNYNEVLFCNHPYDFDSFKALDTQKSDNIELNLVFPGEGRIDKGLLDFIELERAFNSKKNISFSIAGKTLLDKEIYLDSGVDYISSDELITDQQYKVRMEKADYFVLLHNPEMYKYIYSGVLLDAIKFQVPIIAIQNPVFNEFFKKYGHIGYLLDSIVEVKDLIGYLHHNCDDQYDKYLQNIRHISKHYEKQTIDSIRAVLQ